MNKRILVHVLLAVILTSFIIFIPLLFSSIKMAFLLNIIIYLTAVIATCTFLFRPYGPKEVIVWIMLVLILVAIEGVAVKMSIPHWLMFCAGAGLASKLIGDIRKERREAKTV